MHDIFFFTDIHGMYDLYRAIMDFCNEQDPEATIIFGGDACDRGRDGYKIIKELLDNPHVIYLKGNHEEMFCKAARDTKRMFVFKNDTRKEIIRKFYLALRQNREEDQNIINYLYNEGMDTLIDWIMDDMPIDLIERIEHLPLTFSYENCDFCHSAGGYKTFRAVADAECNNAEVDESAAEILLWGRSTLEREWAENRTAIFGHTPTVYLSDYINLDVDEDWDVSPIMFNGQINTAKKVDMDTGAAFTGRAYVLNILTMEAQGFKDINFKNNKVENHSIEKIECIQM